MTAFADLKEFGESAASAVLERVGRGVSRMQERTPLPCDVLESDDAYLVVFDAPGATRSDIQVRFVERQVEVRVDRFRDFHEGFEMRFPGRGLSLDGRAELPADADAVSATATLTDSGTLQVRVPKTRDGDVAVAEESEDADDTPGGSAVGADDTPGGRDESAGDTPVDRDDTPVDRDDTPA